MANKTERDENLQALAARIADDQSVDWASQMDPALAGDPAALGLRELEQIAQGFRHMQLAGKSAAPGACRFTFGSLRVFDRLGEGAQGEVWRAYDPMLDMQVALKLRRLDSDTLGHEFLAEARRLARVRHANIVSVYGAAVEDGRAGLWMELVRGTTLAELLARDGCFPPEEVREIGLDLCRTLAAVHRHGLLHGDIKPENIMREVSGRIVLMDFGIARELDAVPKMTVSGSMRYLAPEVLQGGEPSVASDIYSLGAVLFRLLTGEFPEISALRAARHDAGRQRGHPRLLPAIARALDPDPSRRIAHAMAFAQALAPAPQRSVPWHRIALLAALVLAAGAAAWLWLSQHPLGVSAWRAEATFRRLDAQGSQYALPDGSAIALGDRLVLEFRSSRPAYVYVFDDDGSGEVNVLFPLAGLQPANPLAADVTYRLPGRADGIAQSWQVSREAKRDVFVVLAADAPQRAIEDRIRGWSHARQLDQSATRGALQVVASPLERDIDNPELRAILRDVQSAESAGHVRHWRFSLPHHGS